MMGDKAPEGMIEFNPRRAGKNTAINAELAIEATAKLINDNPGLYGHIQLNFQDGRLVNANVNKSIKIE